MKNRKDFEYLIVNIREPFLLALLSLLIKQLKKRNVCFIFVIANGGCRQAVKASDCGSDIRGFDSHHPPHKKADNFSYRLFYFAEFLEREPTQNEVLLVENESHDKQGEE